MTGEIFDIKHFAVHDGPGIRTTIFLKGCPLHCVWCHNPEGMRRGKDLWVKREACIHCETCIHTCPKQALRMKDGEVSIDRSLCDFCNKCVEKCPARAMQRIDRQAEVKELVDLVTREEIFTREYAKAHREELERVYGLLADDHSRKVLRDVVEYKLTGDIKLLRGCESEPREAWENILRPGKEEHYMDLGAYTGDTIAEFIGYAGEWRLITALEPDPVTFAKLERNTAGLHDCILYRLGAYSRYARLPFAGGAGRGSHLAAGGAMTELDSVDNILCGQTVSLINMDVEGMEAEAIAGMAKTLRRHRPKLLIAGYHRSEDLWRLPLEVLAIQPEYKVYVRHYPCLPAWDVNFYFV